MRAGQGRTSIGGFALYAVTCEVCEMYCVLLCKRVTVGCHKSCAGSRVEFVLRKMLGYCLAGFAAAGLSTPLLCR